MNYWHVSQARETFSAFFKINLGGPPKGGRPERQYDLMNRLSQSRSDLELNGAHFPLLEVPHSPFHVSLFYFPFLQVRFGQQKRYQDWFQRQYLSTPDSQSLRCDLIRYICGVVHPSNEVLSSDILPRWAIIGWLLTTCTVRGWATG